ncbi:uncharacterized protein TM35_000501120, partial [Trypanosoma theileri]
MFRCTRPEQHRSGKARAFVFRDPTLKMMRAGSGYQQLRRMGMPVHKWVWDGGKWIVSTRIISTSMLGRFFLMMIWEIVISRIIQRISCTRCTCRSVIKVQPHGFVV